MLRWFSPPGKGEVDTTAAQRQLEPGETLQNEIQFELSKLSSQSCDRAGRALTSGYQIRKGG